MICTGCQMELPVEAFHTHHRRWGSGFKSRCKACRCQDRRRKLYPRCPSCGNFNPGSGLPCCVRCAEFLGFRVCRGCGRTAHTLAFSGRARTCDDCRSQKIVVDQPTQD